MPQQDSGGEPRKCCAMPGRRHREQMMREITVEHLQTAVDRRFRNVFEDHTHSAGRPEIAGCITESSYINCALRCTSALSRVAFAHDGLVRTRKQRPIVFQPSKNMRRCFRIGDHAGASPHLATNRCGQLRGDDRIRIGGSDVTAECAQVGKRIGGRNDDSIGRQSYRLLSRPARLYVRRECAARRTVRATRHHARSQRQRNQVRHDRDRTKTHGSECRPHSRGRFPDGRPPA